MKTNYTINEYTALACSDPASTELLRLLPPVLRARDYHLYLNAGQRLTDLWLMGGRAILGHKPARVVNELKNSAERGLFVPFPHPAEKRFFKVLAEIFPGYKYRLYNDIGSLCRVLKTIVTNAANSKSILLWRPFLENSGKETANAKIIIPILPWPQAPAVLVLDESLDTSFPAGDLIAPVLLAPATRALYNLVAEIKNKDSMFYKTKYKIIDKKQLKRRGIYLSLAKDIDTETYKNIFKSFLKGGFLIPPSMHEPVILPPLMTPGEESQLAKLLGEYA